MKNLFTSWTIWFGIAQIFLGVVGLLSGLAGQAESFTLIVTGLGTVGFRFKTTTPVTLGRSTR